MDCKINIDLKLKKDDCQNQLKCFATDCADIQCFSDKYIFQTVFFLFYLFFGNCLILRIFMLQFFSTTNLHIYFHLIIKIKIFFYQIETKKIFLQMPTILFLLNSFNFVNQLRFFDLKWFFCKKMLSVSFDTKAVVFGLKAVVFGLKAFIFSSKSVIIGSKAFIFGTLSVVLGTLSVIIGLKAVIFATLSVVFGSNAFSFGSLYNRLYLFCFLNKINVGYNPDLKAIISDIFV